MTLLITVLLALTLDRLLGEPKRAHPLVAFGHLANAIEARLNGQTGPGSRARGILALTLAVLPLTLLAFALDRWLTPLGWLHTLVAAAVLYLTIGWQSLLQHARAVAEPLHAGDLTAARQAVAMIVSRDANALDHPGIARAATESVLENGADAIFSALFWFLVAGIPGVVLYRLTNTLDATWGYKNDRYYHFGWAAARLDDLLNYIPARLTALSYALAGQTRQALRCWQTQAPTWKSPNAGPVMAAGAGALSISLGGSAHYHQQPQHRPNLGPDPAQGLPPNAESIDRACDLVNRALAIWVLVLTLLILGYTTL